MATMRLAEGKAKWEQRSGKIKGLQQSHFRKAMQGLEQLSRAELARQVYAKGGQGKRSGLLRRSERVRMTGPLDALLVNDAKASSQGGGAAPFYAWLVAEGRGAFVLPKRNRPYVWISGRAGGKRGGRRGRGGRQYSRGPLNIPEMPARPWRGRAMERGRTLVIQALARATREMMEG